jgi:peptide/nickel transport system substrate-binding protein
VAAVLATSACSMNVKSGGASTSATGSMLIGADTGSPTFEKNFNPYAPNKRIGTTYMYEPLAVINTLDGKETPFLATGHTTPDPKTVVFDIRTGVKWSDGKPFSASDVVYTFDLLKAHKELDLKGVWQRVDSISVAGQKVTFHLKAADVPAAHVIEQTLIVPEHVWKSVSNPVTDTNAKPVVTGPYTLGAFSPNQYTLTKNKNYWQADKVAADKLVFPASNTQLDIVNNGYDWAYSFMTEVQKTWVGADKQHNTYWFPPGGNVSLYPNLTKAPFNDVNFRQGLSWALDRSKVADNAEQGYVDAASQSGLLLPNQKAALNTALPNGGAITQDTAKALDYFAKAGFTKKGDALVDASGKPLAFSITTANGYSDWLQGVKTVQGQLKAIGIDVKINQPQPAAYNQALQTGDFDLAMGAFGGTGSVYDDFNNLLNSQFNVPVGTSTTSNYERFSDAKVDQTLAALKATSDPAEQKKLGDELQSVVYTQVPAITLFYGGLWGLFSDKQFTGWPTEKNPYASPQTWESNPLLIITHLKKAGA